MKNKTWRPKEGGEEGSALLASVGVRSLWGLDGRGGREEGREHRLCYI